MTDLNDEFWDLVGDEPDGYYAVSRLRRLWYWLTDPVYGRWLAWRSRRRAPHTP